MKDGRGVVTVVQARTGSTRLPGKVLLTACGEPLLLLMLERLARAKRAGTVVVATTKLPEDDAIEALAGRCGVPCFRGSTEDLLDRHLGAAREFGARYVVKVPSDCPLVDPAIVDRVLGIFLAAADRFDYVSNLHPMTWPDGMDVEVMTLDALETASGASWRKHEREHTTPYLWEKAGRFRTANVVWETGRDLSKTVRLTIDYAEDYELIRAVFEALRPAKPDFGLEDVLAWLEAHPEVASRNAAHRGVTWYTRHLADARLASGAGAP